MLVLKILYQSGAATGWETTQLGYKKKPNHIFVINKIAWELLSLFTQDVFWYGEK